jgi:hypothetical protein
MKVRKAAAGLGLSCLLLLFALAAQSASAATAANTTAVTCVLGGGAKDFKDAHCDEKVANGTGSYGHVAIELGAKTELEVSNEKTKNSTFESTPAVLKGTVFGVASEISCSKVINVAVVIEKKVIHEAYIRNEEDILKGHTAAGQIKLRFSSCKVAKPALGCTVKEPIDSEILEVRGREGLGAGKNEMGLEFSPGASEIFAQFTIEGCFIAGTYKVTGTAIGTGTPAPTEKHSGATTVFTNAMTKETLKLAGNPAELSASLTVRMAGGGSPIAFTTTT